MIEPVLVLPLDKAWSDSARDAAAEARHQGKRADFYQRMADRATDPREKANHLKAKAHHERKAKMLAALAQSREATVYHTTLPAGAGPSKQWMEERRRRYAMA